MTKTKNSLLNGSISVLLALIICKITAFFEEVIIASNLGATAVADAFITVKGIQETIYPMLAVGVTQVFLPAYKSIIVQKDQKKADSLANYTIIFFFVLSVILVTLIIVFAHYIVKAVAPGFDGNQTALTTHLVRLSAASYIFICAAAILSSVLLAEGRFFISEIRGAFTHIPVILAAIFFYKRFGLDALAISLVVAGITRFVILIPFIHKGYSFSLKDKPDLNSTKKLLSRLPSAFISSGITQLNTLIDKIMASNLVVGSISCLNYGTRLYMVSQEFFANVIAISTYPKIIELIAENKTKELEDLLLKIVTIIWFFTIPLSVAGIVYSHNFVHLIYVRGAFTPEMGDLTSGIFIAYIAAIAFSSLNRIINNVYFGFGDTRNPMYFNLINLIINIIFNIIFVRLFQVIGLAIATSLSASICLFIRMALLQKRISIKFMEMLKEGIKILLASIFAVGISYGIIRIAHIHSDLYVCMVAFVISFVLYMSEMILIKRSLYEEGLQMARKLLHR